MVDRVNSGSENSLTLSESQRKGSVKLPHCELLINYEATPEVGMPPADPDLGKRTIESRERVVLDVGSSRASSGVYAEVQDSPDARGVIAFLQNSSIVRLRDYRIVGDFVSTSTKLRSLALGICERIAVSHGSAPTNFLLCAEPGAGKSYFVKQLAKEVGNTTEGQFVSAKASNWRHSETGLDRYLKQILALLTNGRRVVAFLDEVDTVVEGHYLYRRLLAPMTGEPFELNGDEVRLPALFWFYAASAACSTKDFGECVRELPPGSKGEDFLSRIREEDRIDLPSIGQNGLERIVRSLSILSSEVPDIDEVEANVLLYIGLTPYRTSRELTQLLTGSLDVLQKGRRLLRWRDLDLSEKTWLDFGKVFGDHIIGLVGKVIRVERT